MNNPFDDPDFCRAYDHYVTVEQPGSWNDGYYDGCSGSGKDPRGQASDTAYLEGYEAGRKEWLSH